MKNKIIALLFLIWILSSCTSTNKEIEKQEKINSFKYNIENAKSQFVKKKTEKIKKSYIEKKLTIDKRCIGCNKCVRIAPNNFAMDFNTRKAIVISQENLDSERVQASIDLCPVDSIHLL